jgi:transposase-like protein
MNERIRRIYTAKQKLRAVNKSIKYGIARHHRESGIPIPTLNFWLKQHRSGIELQRTRSRPKLKKKKVGV